MTTKNIPREGGEIDPMDPMREPLSIDEIDEMERFVAVLDDDYLVTLNHPGPEGRTSYIDTTEFACLVLRAARELHQLRRSDP